MKILAIETSCDETAASFLDISKNKIKSLTNVVSSQVDIHKKTWGIVPEVAAREHVTRILPVIERALEKSRKFDVIAVTRGPGLITSLIVGVETAKALAYAWKKPLIPINHLEGHVYSNWLPTRYKVQASGYRIPKIRFPALNLIISGGHTELVLMKNHLHYQKIGETLDDAAGEAFDKVAKILNFGYPGGPLIEKLAYKGNPKAFDFPRPMLKQKNFNFSFSGLKTSVLYTVKNKPALKRQKENLCASFQQAVFDVLVGKTIRAAKKYGAKSILISGGVTANKELGKQIKKALKKELPKILLSIPLFQYCTDNAAMIAMAAYFHATRKDFTPINKVKVDPSLELK